MNIIESFTAGKTGDDARNEDVLVVTPHFISVIDGVTSKQAKPIDGVSAGRYAALMVAESIAAMPPGLTALDAFKKITTDFAQKIDVPDTAEGPAASVAIYSVAQREIWRVGDGPFMLDGIEHVFEKDIDRINAEFRALAIATAFARGETPDDDFGRRAIAEALATQHHFANRAIPYGYGVVNGHAIPETFIEIFDASKAHEIILASDGYLKLFPTLQQSEDHLFKALRDDPMLYRQYKQTKGFYSGNISFDDRTYIRFTL
jgi:hypothetical protein